MGTVPIRPTNARLIVDDDIIPVELVYEGVDASGNHDWRGIWPLHVGTWRSIKFVCDELPPDTVVTLNYPGNLSLFESTG